MLSVSATAIQAQQPLNIIKPNNKRLNEANNVINLRSWTSEKSEREQFVECSSAIRQFCPCAEHFL
jgi:hypothetical protein